MLRIFTFVKIPTTSAGFEPATLGARGQHARPPKPSSCKLHVNIMYSCLHSDMSIFISYSKFQTNMILAVHIAVTPALFPNSLLDSIKQIKFDEANVQDTKSFFQVTAISWALGTKNLLSAPCSDALHL
jgi:hypothetical protein